MNESVIDREVLIDWYAGQVAALKFFEAVEKNAKTDLDPGAIALTMIKAIDKEGVHDDLENNGILPQLDKYIAEYKLRECYQELKGSGGDLLPSVGHLVHKIGELHPKFQLPANSGLTLSEAYDKNVATYRDDVRDYVDTGEKRCTM